MGIFEGQKKDKGLNQVVEGKNPSVHRYVRGSWAEAQQSISKSIPDGVQINYPHNTATKNSDIVVSTCIMELVLSSPLY